MRSTLCALLLLSLPAAAPAQRRPPPRQRVLVEAVEIEGNRRLTYEELFARVRVRPCEPYDERRVRRGLRSLLDLGLLDATATRFMVEDGLRVGKVVVFHVAELPLVAELKLKGLPRGLAAADVLEAARAKGRGLEEGAVFDPARLRRALGAVRSLLAARGRSGVSAEGHVREVSHWRVSVVIEMTEGRY